jgi:hypothetical protein
MKTGHKYRDYLDKNKTTATVYSKYAKTRHFSKVCELKGTPQTLSVV